MEAFVYRSLVIVQCLMSMEDELRYAAPVFTHQHRRPLIPKLIGQQARWLGAKIPASPSSLPSPSYTFPLLLPLWFAFWA